jgi:hypothetical protein
MSVHSDLRQKIDDAKLRLPLPELLSRLGLSEHAKKTARCPFPGHEDKHPSFSLFQGRDGFWFWKCHAGCGEGDEIMFVSKLKELSLTKAMNLYLDMAGFPSRAPRKSREYPESRQSHGSPESPECHESPKSPVSPVSNGQGLGKELERELMDLPARCACTRDKGTARKRFKLARDVRGVEKRIGCELPTAELIRVFDVWYRISEPFLPNGEPREDHLEKFLAELTKVRVPTGERDTFNKALTCVKTLSDFELPEIPGIPQTPESWRRLAALHRELSRLSTKKDKSYFLSYRDAAKVCHDLSPQKAHDITRALARLGVIKIVYRGVARPNGKAAEFRYLLPQTENGAAQTQKGAELKGNALQRK